MPIHAHKKPKNNRNSVARNMPGKRVETAEKQSVEVTKNEAETVIVKTPAGAGPHAVMIAAIRKIMGLSEREAENVLRIEKPEWKDFQPRGMGQDNKGNVLHRINVPQQFADRTAHESYKHDHELRQKWRGRELGFRAWLLDNEHKGEGLEKAWDRWNPLAQKYGGNVRQDWHGNVAVSKSGSGGNHSTFWEEKKLKEDIIGRIRLERIRARREGLAEEIPNETSSLARELENLSDLIALSTPAGLAKKQLAYGNDSALYSHWLKLRLNIFPLEEEMKMGLPGDIIGPGLSEDFYAMAWHLADHGEQRFGTTFIGKNKSGQNTNLKNYHPWNAEAVKTLLRLIEKGKHRSGVDNQRLLLHFYRMTFAFFELIGREMAYTKKGKNENTEIAGKQLQHSSRLGRKLSHFIEQRPLARKVNASFYPEEQVREFRANDPQTGAQGGVKMHLYLWFDHANAEWVLEDFSNLDRHARNAVPGKASEKPDPALFAALDNRLRLPKGALLYRLPGEGSARILETTGEMKWYQWLRWAALAGIVLAVGLATGGASIPASAVIIGSTAAFAVSDIAEMRDKSAHGLLESKDILIHVSGIVASLAAGGGTAAKLILTPSARLAMGHLIRSGEHGFTHYLALTEFSADATGLLIFSTDVHESLRQGASRPGGESQFGRMLSFYLGMGLMQVVGLKSTLLEASLPRGLNASKSLRVDIDGSGNIGLRQNDSVDELSPGYERSRKRLQKRQSRIDNREEKIAELNKKLSEASQNGILPRIRPQVDVLGLNAPMDIFGGLSREAYRTLFKVILKRSVQNVDAVLLYLQKRGLELRYLHSLEGRRIVQMIIEDVRMRDFNPAEISLAKRYRERFPSSALSNRELQWAQRNGYEMDVQSGHLTDGKAQNIDHPRRDLETPDPAMKKLMEDLEGNPKMDADDAKLIEGLRKQRQKFREDFKTMHDGQQARKAGGEVIPDAEIDQLNKLRSKIGKRSELIAEAQLDGLMKREGFERFYPPKKAKPSGSGDIDRMYVRESGGRMQVVEVKGGTSRFGSRELVNLAERGIVASGVRGQQGSGLYLADIVLGMQKSPNSAMSDTAEELILGFKEHKVDYLYFRQQFDLNGNLGARKAGQFDIDKIYTRRIF